jgi:hypothetical protein
MTTGYSSYTKAEAHKEILAMREFTKELKASPDRARKLLVDAGILTKSGKRLNRKCRSTAKA